MRKKYVCVGVGVGCVGGGGGECVCVDAGWCLVSTLND